MSEKFVYSKDDELVVSVEEQQEIIDWVKKNYLRLRKNGYNRYMALIEHYPDIPKVVFDIKSRIVDKENLHTAIQEPLYKDAIGYMFDGAQLHAHTDPNRLNLIHTRFNVYVKIPEIGGYPIYNGKVLRLKERSYICCRAGLDLHFCQKVYGDRIILSFGFLLPPQRVNNIHYDYDKLDNFDNLDNLENILTNSIDSIDSINSINFEQIDASNLTNLTLIKLDEKINLELLLEKLKCLIVDENTCVSHNIKNDILIKNIISEFINLPKNIKDNNDIEQSIFYTEHDKFTNYSDLKLNTLNYLFKGKKLWLVAPLSNENIIYLKLNNYLSNKNEINDLDLVKKSILQIKNDIIDSIIFIQNEGEVVFIPKLYHYISINLDFSIGTMFNYN